VVLARPFRADAVIGVGGGSSIDLAKLVAMGVATEQPIDAFYATEIPSSTLPVIAVPTTAGTGSEVTPVAVLTDPRRELKVGLSSGRLVPVAAVCDPGLTMGAPDRVTAHAGIDALAHAVEAYTATRRDDWRVLEQQVFVGKNVLSDVYALHAVTKIVNSLTAAIGDDPDARAAMMEGSLHAGLAFATAGTAAAHALQYPLGARTKTAHGLGTGLLLPYVMEFNQPVRETELGQLAAAMSCRERTAAAAIERVAELVREIALPRSLEELHLDRSELAELATQAAAIKRLAENNPRRLDAKGALAILDRAWLGSLAA
jgi:alcohol dehydrogenase